MAATSQNAESNLPQELKNPVRVTNYWTIFFRHGMNANLSKNFYFDGTQLEATRRAQEHCKIMGYRFIFLRPLVCNIDEEEAYKLRGGLDSSESGHSSPVGL